MRRVATIAVLCACLGLGAGCGYTTRSLISAQFRTINIQSFTNKIDITRGTDTASKYKVYRPMLETDVTKAMVNRFMYDGTLKITDPDSADLVLEGDLMEFRRDPLRYTDNDVVQEYRLNIVVNLRLRDTKKNKLVWEEKSFTGDTTYFVSGPQSKSEDTAVNDAIADLSRRIVERVVEQW